MFDKMIFMLEYSSDELQQLLEQAAQHGWDAAWKQIESSVKEIIDTSKLVEEKLSKLEAANKELFEVLRKPWWK